MCYIISSHDILCQDETCRFHISAYLNDSVGFCFHVVQGVAMVCGFLVVVALSVAAFFAHKTRGKIWRYGKPNIQWDKPLVGGKASEGRDVEEWVSLTHGL